MGLRVNKGVKNRGVIEYIKGDKIYGFYPPEKKVINITKGMIINQRSR
jgi:hypothetical protein